MSAFDPRQVLLRLFLSLRRNNFTLGVGELLAAFAALDSGLGTESPDGLKAIIQLLWCKSPDERRAFELLWDAIISAPASAPPVEKRPMPPRVEPPQPPIERAKDPVPESPVKPQTELAPKPAPAWSALPVRAPFIPALLDDTSELNSYWPVSRRSMLYAWRYLRRPVPDGPQDVLDVKTTVERAARQGFFLAPVYRRRERNHAHLILLLDQGGSMAPFHRFCRDMVETSQHESSIQQVDVFYFNNVPATAVYLDPHMTRPVAFDEAMGQCAGDTSVLVVSDAGAARGYRRLPRIRATTEFLSRLKKQTGLIAWLNPMPADRWPSTSAQVISYIVPMFQMDPDGFSNAIDVVRGQPMQHYR